MKTLWDRSCRVSCIPNEASVATEYLTSLELCVQFGRVNPAYVSLGSDVMELADDANFVVATLWALGLRTSLTKENSAERRMDNNETFYISCDPPITVPTGSELSPQD